MSEKEQLIIEIKKQIELLKQEIKDKKKVLDSLLQQLDDIEENENGEYNGE